MVIGITGSFGSGKTEVARMFRRLGAYVIDADRVCRALTQPGGEIYKKVVKNFGRCVLKKNGAIDRKKLGEIVFDRKERLELLNRLIHPEAIRRIRLLAKKIDAGKIIVIDAALLVESGLYKDLDKLIVVRANINKQVMRVIRTRGITRREVIQRIQSQAPLKKKLALADFIIDNNGSRKNTFLQVKKIWKQLR